MPRNSNGIATTAIPNNVMAEAQLQLPVQNHVVQRSHGMAPADKQYRVDDAGALFVLESKGNWLHAGYHLTTSVVAPALLSLPFAFVGLGWAAGMSILLTNAEITFYGYFLFSKVLEQRASDGQRHLRFRDLAHDVLGQRWSRFIVAPAQFCVCFGAVILCAVLGGQSMKYIYAIYHHNGSIKLYEFIIFFGVMMMLLSQLPSFHSLRYVNLISLLLCLGYSSCAIGGSIYAGHHYPTNKNYSIPGGKVSKMFGVFNSFSIIATTYGNGIIPEIQATLAPPVTGKMIKGLCICYAVVASTFFPVAISGYWAFGNQSSGNLLSNLAPPDQPALVPKWLVLLANVLVLLQLLAVALVYSQPTFEVLEGKASDAEEGRFSARNLLPRLALRGGFVALATFISAMLPFFGDINALIGAFGFLPLDFILPATLYNTVFKPSRRSVVFWFNSLIAFTFSLVCILASIASVRQIVLDADTYKLFANL